MILYYLFINSFIILSIYNLVQPGMLLGWAEKYLKRLPKWVKNPLYDCPACMASIHSWPFFYTDLELTFYPAYILALSGVNIFLHSIIGYLNNFIPDNEED